MYRYEGSTQETSCVRLFWDLLFFFASVAEVILIPYTYNSILKSLDYATAQKAF